VHQTVSPISEAGSRPPFVPAWKLDSLHKLCHRALEWHEAGLKKEAGELACWLAQFKRFPSLWSKEYKDAFALLEQIEPIPFDQEPTTDYQIFDWAAFTGTGNGTTMGVIRSPQAEIRAFGPQAFPLSDQSRFGIKGEGMNGWSRCAAMPEVWLEMKASCNKEECRLDVRFAGLEPSQPLSFVFYVKTSDCRIGQEVFKPKSLRRFHGEAKEVVLGGKVKIERGHAGQVQVIPLAGEGCFWDTDFLISFELHPFVPAASFLIKI
jgi:hypothetical protein